MRVQPRKVRIVADEIRGKNAVHAAHLLRFHPSKSAQFLRKILVSAIANAQENNKLSPETLKVVRIQIDEGPRLKRIQARAQGRANRIVKKTSHITVFVDEAAPEMRIKPHGTKAKARPKFEAPKPSKAKKVEAAAPAVEEPVAEAAETVEDAPAVASADGAAEESPVEAAIEEAPAEAATDGAPAQTESESTEGEAQSEEEK